MSVDLTLPASSSPAIDPYKHLPDPLLPFALFVHVKLRDDSELAAIEEACNSESEGATPVLRAPRHDFAGQPLRAALAEHLDNLVSTRRFDPFYFVAVVDEDWRNSGVIMVTLDDGSDDDLCHIDQLRVPAKKVGLSLVNLQIANMDWDDFKEQYGSDGEDGDDGGDSDRDQGPPTADPVDSTKPFDSPQTDEEYSDGASSTLRNLDYYIGFYAIPGIDFETVMRELHPCWGPRVSTPDLGCRPEGRVSADSQVEAVAQAKRTYPIRCRNNPHLHRGMFLIVDTANYHEDGVLLVKLDWDEKQADDKATTTAELAALGEAATTDTQRIPFANATTMTVFNEIKAGYRPWKHAHKTFLAYAGPRTNQPSGYLAAVDKTFARRKSGAERFLEKNVQHEPTAAGGAAGFQTALDQHWAFVHEARFCATLCPEYFVYCDEELAAKDTKGSVALVKVDRQGDWSAVQCEAGKAYQVLCDLVDRKRDWAGQKKVPISEDKSGKNSKE